MARSATALSVAALCLLLGSVDSQGTSTNYKFSLSYPIVRVVSSPLTGNTFNISLDVSQEEGSSTLPMGSRLTCTLESVSRMAFLESTGPSGTPLTWSSTFFSRTVTSMFSAGVAGGGGGAGYKYVARIAASFSNSSNAPEIVRASCILGSTGGNPIVTSLTGLGISPQILNTKTTWNYDSLLPYTAGNPFGPIMVSGLDAMPCDSNSLLYITFGSQQCVVSTSTGAAVSSLCDTVIANPFTDGSTGPKTWKVYCTATLLGGWALPVTIHYLTGNSLALAASNTPDAPILTVNPLPIKVDAVDIFPTTDPYSSTRYTVAAGSTTITGLNPSGLRVAVTFGNSPKCPRVSLVTNTTVMESWNFAANSLASCSANATLLTGGNVATIANFPGSTLGGGTGLDRQKLQGYRLVVTDVATPEFPSSSETQANETILLRYAAPVITSVTLGARLPIGGALGSALFMLNVTADKLGPFPSSPKVNVNGRTCGSVIRVSTNLITCMAQNPGKTGAVTIVNGDVTSAPMSVAFPDPIITSVDSIPYASWSAQRTYPSGSNIPGPLPRGSTIRAAPGEAFFIHGMHFGAWQGNGTQTPSPMQGANPYVGYGSNSIQCIAAAWAGRGATAAAPNCNGILDYLGEGELPSENLVLFWNDTLIVFRVPPAGATVIEPVVVVASTTTLATRSSWTDVSALVYVTANSTITVTPLAANSVGKAASVGGGDVLSLDGKGFGMATRAATTSLIGTPIPVNFAALSTATPIAYSSVLVVVGDMTCLHSSSSAASLTWTAAMAPSSLVASALTGLPAACTGIAAQGGVFGAGSFTHINETMLTLSLPAGSGAEIPLTPTVIDLVPDATTNALIAVRLTPKNGYGTNFSYALPSITTLTPTTIAINTLSNVLSAATVRVEADNIAVESTAGTTYGSWSSPVTVSVQFIGQAPNSSTYSLQPTSGLDISKIKGATAPYTAMVLGATGYAPNVPVGAYDITLSVSSSSGVVRQSRVASQGPFKAICASGWYAAQGETCRPCTELTGARCPGGNANGTGADLAAPVFANAGYYNLQAGEASACPIDATTAQHPAGRDVCVLPCSPAAACTGDNTCAAGYTSAAPHYMCARCATDYARVNATCEGFSGRTGWAGTCVSHTVCTGAGATVGASIGQNGEDLCVCGNDVPLPSASPTSTVTPSASVTSLPSPTPSPSVSQGSQPSSSPSATPSPSASGSTGATTTPTPSQAAASCTDGRKNADETDVDCGGSTCGACSAGMRCRASTDCASPGANSDHSVICASAALICTDTRVTQGYWDSIVSTGGNTDPSAPKVLLYSSSLDATVAPAGLTTSGLNTLRDAYLSSAAQSLTNNGVTSGSVSVSVAITTIVRRDGSGRRLTSGDVPVTLNITLIVSPSTTAGASWSTEMNTAVTAGAFSQAVLLPLLTSTLGYFVADGTYGPGAVAWQSVAQSVGNVAISQPVSATPQAILSVEAANGAVAPPGSTAGAAGGAVAVIIGLVAVLIGFVMYKLRTEGHIAGHRMTPLATLGGLWPQKVATVKQWRLKGGKGSNTARHGSSSRQMTRGNSVLTMQPGFAYGQQRGEAGMRSSVVISNPLASMGNNAAIYYTPNAASTAPVSILTVGGDNTNVDVTTLYTSPRATFTPTTQV